MCQTYANFPCASVVNYRYEVGMAGRNHPGHVWQRPSPPGL